MTNFKTICTRLLALVIVLICSDHCFAQVTGIAINDTSITADISAMLDINVIHAAAKKGLLIPRVTTTERDAIGSPAKSLLLFNTTNNRYEYNAGTSASPNWVALLSQSGGWTTTGNSGSTAGTNFLGTTDNAGLLIKVNNTNAGFIDQSTSTHNLYLGLGSGNYGTNSGQYNVALGADALNGNTSGNYNTALGKALTGNSTGSNNVGVGYGANNSATGLSNNTLIGYNAVSNNSNATAIGYSAQANGLNATVLGNGATTSQDNALILGNSSVNVGIGTSTPNTGVKLDVNGSYKLGTSGTAVKNNIAFSTTLGSTTLTGPATSILNVLGLNVLGSYAAGSTDVDITIPAINRPSSTQAVVKISPAADLPNAVSISYARLTSTSNVRVRFINAGSSSATVSGTFYISIEEF